MEVQQDASSLLISAYRNGKWSDLTIINKTKEYQVHKHILATSIPYFDKMFSTGLSESTSQLIKLDHPAVAFDLIIEWAYCSKILITKENAVDLFHLADYMNILELTAECLDFLWNNFSDSPIIDIDHWIKQIVTEETRKIIDKYIRSNFCDIVHTEAFLDYDVDTVDYMISLNGLNIRNEIIVFDAIIRWIQADEENRSTHFAKLLQKVNCADIKGEQFMNIMDRLCLIKRCADARPVIMAALELTFYKSLEQDKINDFNFNSRQQPAYHYFDNILILPDSSIRLDKSLLYGIPEDRPISLSVNSNLPVAKFGDLSVTEHEIEEDVVIRIDWKNCTYRLLKQEYCSYMLMFDRLFQFNRNFRKVYLWKGDREIELASIPDNVKKIFTVTKYKGCFYFASTVKTNYNIYAFDRPNHQYKSTLHLTKFNPCANSWKDIASYEIVTAMPIERLRSNNSINYNEELRIYVDQVAVVTYDFDSGTFKEDRQSNYTISRLSTITFYHLTFAN